MNEWVGELSGEVVVIPDCLGAVASDGRMKRRRRFGWLRPGARSIAREVGQSFFLMALMVVTLSAFVGLGLLAVWVLG
jgi:hypothetical protein